MENSVGNPDLTGVFHNRHTSSLRKVGTARALVSGSFGNPGLVPRTRNRESRFGGGTIRSLTSQTPRGSAIPQQTGEPHPVISVIGRKTSVWAIRSPFDLDRVAHRFGFGMNKCDANGLGL
jgi:hypothetical protein